MRFLPLAVATALLLTPAAVAAHTVWQSQAVTEAGFRVMTPKALQPMAARPGDRPGTRLYGASNGDVAYLVSIVSVPSPQASDDSAADQLLDMAIRGETLVRHPRRVGPGMREYVARRDGLISRIRIKVQGDRVIVASVADGAGALGPNAVRFLNSVQFLP